jgi:hypothetical protein
LVTFMHIEVLPAKCTVCGESDPRVVREYHHVYGCTNGPEDTILLCYNCHKKLTEDQNALPPKARKRGAGRKGKLAMEFVSVGSLVELLGQRIKKRGYAIWK